MLKIKTATLSTGDISKKANWIAKPDSPIRKMMQYIAASDSDISSVTKVISESYPWCFLLADRKADNKKFFFGAVVKFDTFIDSKVFVSYVTLDVKRVFKELTNAQHIAFWQARILALLLIDEKIDNVQWRDWTLILQRSTSIFWDKFLFKPDFRFEHKKNILLAPSCKTDYELLPDAGVNHMPWKGWPEIICASDELWLWRQSRQARIIDCRKVTFQ